LTTLENISNTSQTTPLLKIADLERSLKTLAHIVSKESQYEAGRLDQLQYTRLISDALLNFTLRLIRLNMATKIEFMNIILLEVNHVIDRPDM